MTTRSDLPECPHCSMKPTVLSAQGVHWARCTNAACPEQPSTEVEPTKRKAYIAWRLLQRTAAGRQAVYAQASDYDSVCPGCLARYQRTGGTGGGFIDVVRCRKCSGDSTNPDIRASKRLAGKYQKTKSSTPTMN